MTYNEFHARLLLTFHNIGDALFERYHGIKSYDMVVRIGRHNQVYIKYDLAPPDPDVWENTETFHSFAEAWEFISAFITEHPNL